MLTLGPIPELQCVVLLLDDHFGQGRAAVAVTLYDEDLQTEL